MLDTLEDRPSLFFLFDERLDGKSAQKLLYAILRQESHLRVRPPRMTWSEQVAGDPTVGLSDSTIVAQTWSKCPGGQKGRLKPDQIKSACGNCISWKVEVCTSSRWRASPGTRASR